MSTQEIIEDVQCEAARAASLNAVITRNAKDYAAATTLPVYTPIDFLEHLKTIA